MSEVGSLITSIRNSQLLRLCLVGVLTIITLIPILFIGGLVSERRGRSDAAIAEVSSKWGQAQSISGPVLVVPYVIERRETDASGQSTVRTEARQAIVLPRTLEGSGRIETDVRSRGIFAVPVYSLNLSLTGEFGPPDLSGLDIDPTTIQWDRAHLAVGISDVRAIREQSTLALNESQLQFLPGTGGFAEGGPGIHANIDSPTAQTGFRFSFPLALNGSMSVYLAPVADATVLRLTSNSQYPNFQGNWLPAERSVTDAGFEALWRVSYLGRNYPQVWTSNPEMQKSIEASRFGVELSNPIDHYRMSERSVKYAGLFILLTFASIWLIEVLADVRVHAIQYLMVGAALCVFYLLELSLSEHIRFSLAYATASISIVLMIAAYSRVIFGRERRSAVVVGGVTALYGYLFVLLTNEDGALLVGSIGLFVILGLIMYATRRIDWGGPARENKTEQNPA
jgi:inner membrane protein